MGSEALGLYRLSLGFGRLRNPKEILLGLFGFGACLAHLPVKLVHSWSGLYELRFVVTFRVSGLIQLEFGGLRVGVVDGLRADLRWL